jgi:hypothetical protein
MQDGTAKRSGSFVLSATGDLIGHRLQPMVSELQPRIGQFRISVLIQI